MLDGLVSGAFRTLHNTALRADLAPVAGGFRVEVCNPPFEALNAHLNAAITCYADGGRLSVMVAARLFDDREAMAALAGKGRIVGELIFPARAFASRRRHGDQAPGLRPGRRER